MQLKHQKGKLLLRKAVAAGAEVIVTQNVRDFRGGELRFPQLEILTAARIAMRLR